MTEAKTKRIKKAKTSPEEAKLEDILQPSTSAKEFKITIEFGYKPSQTYLKAVEIAKKNHTYTETGEDQWKRHSVTYTRENVEELFELFSLVHEWDKVDVLVNHKKIPYGHQLWLPLMWFARIK